MEKCCFNLQAYSYMYMHVENSLDPDLLASKKKPADQDTLFSKLDMSRFSMG